MILLLINQLKQIVQSKTQVAADQIGILEIWIPITIGRNNVKP
ncbi:unnamed protein product, partial [marine sediment metagenome]